ncbi:MAG: hypothetical protein J7M24_06305, partial [Candidatus Latescibacteria bacterium]|nr:hypothetical protein [Candidatus Latescibacterota bacterium]
VTTWCLPLLAVFVTGARTCAGGVNHESWTAADMIEGRRGWSLMRYGSFGVGAYPYRPSMPGARIRVRVDGVPLRALSPFGPDLESIPAELVGSLSENGARGIDITTALPESDDLLTRTSFHLGRRQQFRFQASLQRRLNGTSGLFIGGVSSGMRGSDTIMGSGSRYYLANYTRTLKNGSPLVIGIHGSRDRDSLGDVTARKRMGHRETDGVALSLRLDDYHLGERTTMSPAAYYAVSKSRFRRYGFTKSLDDDAAGGSVTVETIRGDARYALLVRHDTRFVDSRIHGDAWARHETDVSGSFDWERDGHAARVNGGVRISPHFGAEPYVAGDAELGILTSLKLRVSSEAGGDFPDAGDEYYPALVFGAGNGVSGLESYRYSESEAGIEWDGGMISAGVTGYLSSGKAPFFDPVTPAMRRGESVNRYGGRMRIASENKDRYAVAGVATYIAGNEKSDDSGRPSGGGTWPYPEVDVNISGEYVVRLVNGRLESTMFGDVRFYRWEDAVMAPSGNHTFLDLGVSVTVKTLTAFIEMENITGSEMYWFDTMEWMGRNTLWGIRWNLMN